eukprot:GHVL01011051.1.p1 GENE.GHVL01011051.1~~GHVL01011051.1.p1  ORF type:complete len:170 (+),score=17.80 GHVL01011051.1:62-571(+)
MKSREYFEGTMYGGAFSGVVGRLALHPIDTCKAKLQVNKEYSHVSSVLKATLKNEGIFGFYRGFGVTCIGSVPATCLYFSSFFYFQDSLCQLPISAVFVDFIAGFLAEVVACILFVPIDVAKQQLQTQRELQVSKHSGSLDALKNLIRHSCFVDMLQRFYLLAHSPLFI